MAIKLPKNIFLDNLPSNGANPPASAKEENFVGFPIEFAVLPFWHLGATLQKAQAQSNKNQ